MEEKVLRQLQWIKWLLMSVVAGVLISITAAGWSMWQTLETMSTPSKDCSAPQSAASFQEDAKSLLLKGKEQEVLTLTASREVTFPKDPYVFLYRGRAQFQLREYEKAIEALRVAEDLSPDWRDQYIAPYVSEAKRRLSVKTASGSSAGQNEPLPPTATEVYELQVKKAEEQQQRMDQLLATQEEHAKRFGAILEKWERQTGLKKP